jgi:ABC-type multidrug transport system fused ATPase/permease subunit
VDHIYVLDHGVIVEHGRHEDLITPNGRFAEMFANQI